MKIKRIVVIGTVAKVIIVTGIAFAFSGNPKADQGHPDLAAVFNRNYQQYADHFGNVARTAFDASGRVIGTQVGTYRPGAPNGMIVEMTYLQPDAEHPRGQAFDGAGNPTPLH
jgi:hypothetical protein